MNKNRRRIPVAITAASSLLFLTGCSPEMQRGFLPDAAGVTNHTDLVIGLWTTSWIVLLLVGAISWALMAWALIVYRRRKGETEMPVQLRYNLPIETLFTVIPLILVVGFFAFTARDMSLIENPVEEPDVRIEVVAKQWSWDFNYVDDNVYFSGIQAQVEGPDPDVLSKLPTLYLPVGKSVQIELNSRDVIHSFWVVDFLYKKDMFPGHTNYMYFTPLKEGTYIGKCAELCGEYHSMMLFNVKVVSLAEYEKQMGQLAVAGNVGQLSGEFDRNQNMPGGKVTRED
ncbi:cytochrome c oxidase subunit II [Candidatus Aquiluna sp. UB-MaderosW2red]|uniref:aa3-type cytochrome oxidase subunit II n=1 Tax=Candidatus Aquiluna sp. UB-MaderosW2red TaxID=1855377 RepID=UPI000875CBCB|nr:cytochrome c oxidase subunit 2 [Candidatus Aquiluna sp. UB-MaderosW2red]